MSIETRSDEFAVALIHNIRSLGKTPMAQLMTIQRAIRDRQGDLDHGRENIRKATADLHTLRAREKELEAMPETKIEQEAISKAKTDTSLRDARKHLNAARGLLTDLRSGPLPPPGLPPSLEPTALRHTKLALDAIANELSED